MARNGITYDQVANAAAAIRARGIEPTISAVRQEMGNQGSYTTISNHLAKWRDEASNLPEPKALPPEVENVMLEALTTVWNIAVKHADREVASIRQEADDDKKVYSKQLEEAADEISNLENLCQQNDEEITKLMTEREADKKALHQAQAELDATKRLYAELLKTLNIKPQAASDTKPARQKGAKASPENTQVETQ